MERHERRKMNRLAALPADRKCPHCDKPVLKSRSWVIKDDWTSCRRCYYTSFSIRPGKREEDTKHAP